MAGFLPGWFRTLWLTVALLSPLCTAVGADSPPPVPPWQEHPGWDLLCNHKPLEAAKAFARDLETAGQQFINYLSRFNDDPDANAAQE